MLCLFATIILKTNTNNVLNTSMNGNHVTCVFKLFLPADKYCEFVKIINQTIGQKLINIEQN